MLAWFIIFMHGIIPHNHLQENFNGCHELLCKVTPEKGICDLSSKFKHPPADEEVCHFSSLLFNNLTQDNFLISTNKETHFYQVSLAKSDIVHKAEQYLSKPY